MSDFRTKLLGLAGAAMAFASVAYGQQATCTATAPAPTGIRAEGQTDLTGDVVLYCQNLNGAAAVLPSVNPGNTPGPVAPPAYPVAAQPPAAVFLLTNLPASSIFLGNSGGLAYTEALAIVSNPSGPLPAAPVGIYGTAQGYITSSGLDFINIPTPALPATAGAYFTITFTNIRVNAASNPAVGIATVQPYITGSPILNQNFISAVNVGTITSGLNPITLSSAPGTPLLPANGILEYICQAVSATIYVNVSERFQTAFKTRGSTVTNGVYQPEAFQTINTETGYTPAAWPETPGALNVASSATRLKLVFANVPPGLNVYALNIVQSTTDPVNVGVIQLTASETGGFTPVPTPTITGVPAGYSLIGTGSSTVTTFQAVYEITAQSPVLFENFSIPVFLAAPANTLNPSGPMTIATSFAPIVPIPAANVVETFINYPSFVSNATPINAEYQTFCITTLLFPYVTNFNGTYETGIAIANTTTDNLGVGGKSISVPTSGTCTINFYNGIGTQPTAFTTPNLGVGTTAGSVYANTLTVMSGATGFTGYAIALCNFLEGHGFAFITDNDSGSATSAFAQGYLAVVIPNTRFEQIPAILPTITEQ